MKYLTDQQLAARFSVHFTTIWRWARERDDFPKPIKLGPNTSRWRLSDIEAYEEAQAQAA